MESIVNANPAGQAVKMACGSAENLVGTSGFGLLACRHGAAGRVAVAQRRTAEVENATAADS